MSKLNARASLSYIWKITRECDTHLYDVCINKMCTSNFGKTHFNRKAQREVEVGEV